MKDRHFMILAGCLVLEVILFPIFYVYTGWSVMTIVNLIFLVIDFTGAAIELSCIIIRKKSKKSDPHYQRNSQEVLYRSNGITPEIYNILLDWKAESGVQNLALKTKYNEGSGEKVLCIYTDSPGRLIGHHGSIVEKYKKMLSDLRSYIGVKDIKISQIDGFIIGAEKVDPEEYYAMRYGGDLI